MIKKIMKFTQTFIKEMSVTDYGFLKLCLLALGILIGVRIPKKAGKAVGTTAAIVFLSTFVPFLAKAFKLFKNNGTCLCDCCCEDCENSIFEMDDEN